MNLDDSVHGDTNIVKDGRIIIVRLSGMFNELGVKQFTGAIKEIVYALKNEEFAILVNDLELKGGTPEAYAEVEKYNQWLNTQRLVAKAMVIDSVVHKNIINKLSPSLAQQNVEYFTNEENALAWLITELAC